MIKKRLGVPGIHLFLTDDPARDKKYFPRA